MCVCVCVCEPECVRVHDNCLTLHETEINQEIHFSNWLILPHKAFNTEEVRLYSRLLAPFLFVSISSESLHLV